MRYIYRQRGTFRATSTDSTHPISDPSYNLVRAHLSLGSVYAPAIEFGIRELNRGRDARACIAVSESAPGFVLEAHRHRWVLVLLILKRKARAKAIERTSLAQLHAATRGFAFKGTHRIGPFTPELCPYTTIPSVGTFPARKSVLLAPWLTSSIAHRFYSALLTDTTSLVLGFCRFRMTTVVCHTVSARNGGIYTQVVSREAFRRYQRAELADALL